MRADLLVVGAGIVGLACARALQRRWPTARLVVIDKEAGVARQQSGHNSGVLHSGIYYAPGSRKAQLCREGRRRMVEFCEAKGIAHHVSGKVIVARGLQEVARLERLEERGRANGLVGLERLNSEGLGKREPEVVADAALWVPEAGVVDFRDVCEALREELHGQGAEIALDWRVTSIEREKDFLRLRNARGETWETRSLLNCAGLQSDRVAQASGASIDLRVIPFRGEYWRLSESAAARVRGLIYPVPDPELPFLGVHLTRDIHGRVDAGPNAVLAFAREGYRARDVEWRHLAQTLGYPGFWRLGRKHLGSGWREMQRSLRPSLLLADLQRLVPAIRAEDLRRAGSGVRAQVIGPTGALVDDFHFVDSPRALHVINAPSPAATASLAIAEAVADRAQHCLDLG